MILRVMQKRLITMSADEYQKVKESYQDRLSEIAISIMDKKGR